MDDKGIHHIVLPAPLLVIILTTTNTIKQTLNNVFYYSSTTLNKPTSTYTTTISTTPRLCCIIVAIASFHNYGLCVCMYVCDMNIIQRVRSRPRRFRVSIHSPGRFFLLLLLLEYDQGRPSRFSEHSIFRAQLAGQAAREPSCRVAP